MKKAFLKLKNMRINSLFYKLSIAFLAFFIIPVIISSIVFYNYSTNIVENEVNNSNHSLLKHACEVTDMKMYEIQRVIFDLWGKSYVKKLSNPVFNQEEAIELLSQSIDHLQNVKNTNDFIEGIYVYYIANDFFISNHGKMDFNTFFTRESSYSNMSNDAWKKFFNSVHTFDIMGTEKAVSYSLDRKIEKVRNLVTIVTTLPFKDHPKAVIGIQIDENRIKEILNKVGLTKNGCVYIIDRDGKVVSHTKGDNRFFAADAVHLKMIKEKDMGSYISGNNGKSMNSFVTSKFTGWTFVAEIPYGEISQRSHVIKLVTFIVCTFFMLAGIIISLSVSSRMYNPIKDLVDKFYKNAENASEFKKQPVTNELRAISSGMENIISHNRKLKSIIDSNIDGMRQKVLFDFINGKLHNSEFVKCKSEELGISFKYQYYAAAALKFEFFKQAYEQFTLEEIAHIKSGLCEIIGAITSREKIYAYSFETDKNDFVAILNLDSNATITLKQTFKEIIGLFNYDNNLVRLTVSITPITEELSGIPALFKEACRALNYRALNKKSQIIDPESIGSLAENAGFYYPFTVEGSIYNLMLAGSYEKALEQVHQVMDQNIENNPSYEFLIEVSKAIMNTLGKVIASKNLSINDIFGSELDIYNGLRNFTTVEEIKEFFDFAFGKTGKYIQNSKRSSNDKLLKEIMDYLNEHYTRDIYLELVSEKVGSTPKYVSRFFKEQTGVNFVDYVNKLRIQKAKELLAVDESKVQDVCRKVGFENVNSFIRVFKKYEGISPGLFKELDQQHKAARK